MAYRKLETRVPSYLDEVLGKVSSLPNDLKQHFSKIRELDARCVALQAEAERLNEECQERGQSKSRSTESLKNIWKELEETQREMIALTDQKVKLAEKAYDSVDRNVRQLDEKLREFEAHLRAEGKWPLNVQDRRVSIGSGSTLKSSRERSERKLSNLAVIEDMPVDPNEPRYCYCNQVSYGEMIACDNTNCPYEWFHFQCVGLTSAPEGLVDKFVQNKLTKFGISWSCYEYCIIAGFIVLCSHVGGQSSCLEPLE
ncbi:Inhibitor of growth protein 4 [Galdieria sulphuraria]|nr:Inhibitor of growth protein 4 [Galdieria sulphuraria]